MNFPKLKHPRLCRFLTYAVVLGCGLLPVIAVFSLPVPDIIRVAVMLGSLIGLLIYLSRNFMVLMMMDMALASLSCYRTARTQYILPEGRTADTIRRSILHYGRQCDPAPIRPQPAALRYKFSNPMTVYSRGIERVVAAYETDFLDSNMYRDIFRSAKANSTALAGRQKALFLDKQQAKRPLHRVTVVLILAHRVDPQMIPKLYELLCKQCGDESENCVVPCVVDLSRGTCVFHCLRIPYVGFGYAVKNRGIRIIRNRVFGGNLNLNGNTHFLEPTRDLNPEDTLWDLWKTLHHQLVGADRESKRRFESLAQLEMVTVENTLYLKWDQRGIRQAIELDTETKTARVEPITNWFYPKMQPIGKQTIRKIEEHITSCFARQGYTVEFADAEAVT